MMRLRVWVHDYDAIVVPRYLADVLGECVEVEEDKGVVVLRRCAGSDKLSISF